MVGYDKELGFEEMKAVIFEAIFEATRDRAHRRSCTHAEIISVVCDWYINTFDSDSEEVLFNIIVLTLSGGWNEINDSGLRKDIDAATKRGALSVLMDRLPDNERLSLEATLVAVGISPRGVQ